MNRKCSIIPFLLILWLTSGCQSRGEYSDFYFDYFDTFTSFTAYAEDEQTFQNYSGLVQSVLGTYHKLLDPYHAYDGLTNLYTLNQSAGQGPIKVSEKLFSFLQFSLDAYEISRHSVNIALGPVTGLWREAIRSDSPSVPSRERTGTSSTVYGSLRTASGSGAADCGAGICGHGTGCGSAG